MQKFLYSCLQEVYLCILKAQSIVLIIYTNNS